MVRRMLLVVPAPGGGTLQQNGVAPYRPGGGTLLQTGVAPSRLSSNAWFSCLGGLLLWLLFGLFVGAVGMVPSAFGEGGRDGGLVTSGPSTHICRDFPRASRAHSWGGEHV